MIQDPTSTLQEIRQMMERSSRFISLSGMSGVAAGIFAIAGGVLVYLYLGKTPFDGELMTYAVVRQESRWGLHYLLFFFLTGGFVLLGAIGSAIYFTTRKARRKELPVWDATSKRFLINLLIPLATGALFACALVYHNFFGLTGAVTLIFYGLALLNVSKYSLPEIRYLGLKEIAFGLISAFFIEYVLEFWILGFGIAHIVYGLMMWKKYEQT